VLWSDSVRGVPPSNFEALCAVSTESEDRLSAALELSERRRLESQRLSGVGFWEMDHKSKTLYWSEEIFAIYGLEVNAFEPDYDIFVNLIHDEDRAMVADSYRQSVASGREYNIRYRIKSGACTKWIEARGVTYYDNAGEPERSIGTAQDISEVVDAQHAAEHLASHDALTGLANRNLFAERISQWLQIAKRTSQTLAIIFLDLDNFKAINDRYGHQVGDELLVGVAERLQTVARASDIFARIGGDEFVGLLFVDQPEGIEKAVERFKEVVDGVYSSSVGRIQVTTSIGVTSYPLDCDEPDVLLRHADHAMYEAKESGRAQIRVFDSRGHRSNLERRSLLTDIEHAIQNDEFELYFQPRLSLREGTPVGAEALLRWFRPQGAVAPSTIIELVTGTALAWELDCWVIRALLEQHHRFFEAGVAGPFSFNVNPSTLENPKFPELLAGMLLDCKARGENFEIEILEVSSIADFTKTSESLQRCKALGFSFSLDDFGTGYSSLTHFHALPVDKLKIDQRFVRALLSDDGCRTLVQSILAIAKANATASVAEGIESLALVGALCDMGCEFGQGFGFARPMSASDYLGWVQAWDRQDYLARVSDASMRASGDVSLQQHD